MLEEWKEIDGYKDYLVSNMGRVKSLKYGKERLLVPQITGSGSARRKTVFLRENRIVKPFFVHCLVKASFDGPREKGMVIDHINGDAFDNTLSNLRYCTPSQNQMNSSKTKRKKTSRYKGVCFVKSKNKWCVQIRLNGLQKVVGWFSNEKDAAIAYNEKAVELFGEYARPNIFDEAA